MDSVIDPAASLQAADPDTLLDLLALLARASVL